MSDEALSAAAGQSGITITTNLQINNSTSDGADLTLTDTDGGSPNFTAFTSAGTINLRNFGVTGNAVVYLDAGSTATTAELSVNVTLPSALNVNFQTLWPGNTGFAGVLDMCTSPGTGLVCATSGATPVVMTTSSGVTFSLSATTASFQLNLGQPPSPLTFGAITDTSASGATLTVSGSQTTPNLALVDPANLSANGSVVGGAGFVKLTISGLNGGTNSTVSNDTTFDIGSTGLKLNFGSSAMTNVSFVATGVTIGNVGTTSANNGVGLVALTNLSLANTSILVSGH